MKKPKVLILALVVCVLGVFAATFDPVGTSLWSDTYDSTLGNDYGYDAAVDSQGNVIVVGNVAGAANHGINGYAMKYNPAGDTVLWSTEFDSGAIGSSGGADSSDAFNSVCVDSEDNFIIVGQKAVPFGTYPTNQVFYIVKYESDGTFLWDEEWYVYGWDTARHVCVDSEDDIYVFGDDFGDWGATRGRWTILKYDREGGSPILGPIYYNLYGNEYVIDRCYGGAVDQDGNIIAVGCVGISGSSGSLTNNYDWHVRYYNSSAVLQWSDTYAGSANLYDLAISVEVDSNGDVFVCGYRNVGTDNSTNADYDWLIIKYDKDTGTRLRTKTLKSGIGRSEYSYGLDVDFEDNVLVSGVIKKVSGVLNRAIVKLRGTDLGVLNAQWWNATEDETSAKLDHNYGRIAIAGRAYNGGDNDIHAQCLWMPFNNLRLEKPADGASLTDPPTFKWNPDGGELNSFAVEFAFNPSGPWQSTEDRLGLTIWDNSWTLPTGLWNNKVPMGTPVYWRVVGRDTGVSPAVYITSDEVRSFTKN